MQCRPGHIGNGGWLRVAAAAVLSLAMSGAPVRPAQAADTPKDLARLLVRSGSYVREFQKSFAEVLSTETYQQTVRRTGIRAARTRQIESEMFFAAVGEGAASMTIR